MPSESLYLLIHQLPARPLYLRARIRKQLLAIGAAPLKKAVYALPRTPESLASFNGVIEEIRAGGGDAFLFEARFAGTNSGSLRAAAHQERRADYDRVQRDAQSLLRSLRGRAASPPADTAAKLRRLQTRLERIRTIDHFSSGADAAAAAALKEIGRLLAPRSVAGGVPSRTALAGHTWVTRKGLHVDRLACAWVVLRFIDAHARFRFADPAGLKAGEGEITFDVPGGTIAHEAGGCSVETLVARAGIADPAVRRIAEIVHDIDLKDGRFGHPETAGIEQLVAGIVGGHDDDRQRLERGLALFDDLHRSFARPARVRLSPGSIPVRPPGPRRSRT